ncbi:MAG: hypothetical protein KDA44_12835 [Planctomycetales bacterium]|nr:hypothetical protein [Planctomycetales bacterium]
MSIQKHARNFGRYSLRELLLVAVIIALLSALILRETKTLAPTQFYRQFEGEIALKHACNACGVEFPEIGFDEGRRGSDLPATRIIRLNVAPAQAGMKTRITQELRSTIEGDLVGMALEISGRGTGNSSETLDEFSLEYSSGYVAGQVGVYSLGPIDPDSDTFMILIIIHEYARTK